MGSYTHKKRDCCYPLVNIQKAMENGPVEIVDLPSYKMGGSFHCYVSAPEGNYSCMLYHIISYLIISYHIISYHISYRHFHKYLESLRTNHGPFHLRMLATLRQTRRRKTTRKTRRGNAMIRWRFRDLLRWAMELGKTS